MSDTLRGRLLVATPELVDPNFAHTVVLVVEHTDEGAAGLVLNRPSSVGVADALPDWEVLAARPPKVFLGGPVRRDGLIVLGQGSQPLQEAVLGAVGVVDLESDPVVLAAELERVRLFVGYAGWGPGQLDEEVDAGGWFVVDGDPGDVFSDDPDRLWRGVLVRQGGMFTTVPEDPSAN